jgi:outer membrane biosynthesis protein TonB
LAACAGTREPLVTAELVYGNPEAERPTTLATLVFPPVCEALTLPEYPGSLLDADLRSVAVRVDFTIDSSGTPKDVSATVLDPTEHDRTFGRIAEETVAAWRCEPAAKPPRPGDEVLTPRPIDYRTRVTFRFYSDRSQHDEAVEVDFDQSP